MSNAAKRPFEEEWPALAGLLRAWLTRRGFSPHHIDDVIQETGLKLFRTWDRVDPQRSIRGLTFTIANNVLWEERRRSSFVQLTESIPDVPAPHDVETMGIARLELHRVNRALCELSCSQRDVLLAEVGSAPLPARSPHAIKMLRMRARKRLTALLEGASASALAFVGDAKRLLWRWSSLLSRRESALVFDGPASTLVALCGAVAVAIATTSIVLPSAEGAPGSSGGASASPSESLAASELRAVLHGPPDEIADSRARVSPDPRRDRDKSGYTVSFGEDGPVSGGATVDSSREKKKDGLEPPECSVEREGDYGVTATCRIDTGEEEYEVEATVEVRP